MKRLGLLVLLLVAALAWGPEPAWAKRYHEGPAGGNRVEENAATATAERGRWQQMSPEQRKELKQRYRQFQQLPPDEQQKLRQRYERFRELSPEKKQRMLERHKRLQQLTPQQRQELHREWQRIKQLPPEQRSQQRRLLRQQYFNGQYGKDRP